MSRTIDVTSGYSEYVVAKVTEADAADLSSATFEVALDSTLTVADVTGWQAADVTTFPTTGTALVSLLVDDVAQIGASQWLWVRVTDVPEVIVRRCTNDHVTVV